jgi:nucleotide-binding universal stress UspA family protein
MMKVLLALDGSGPSLVARDLVAALAWPVGTELHLVSAYQVPADSTAGMGSTMDWVGDAEDAARDALDEQLRTLAAPIVERGMPVERHVIRRRAPDAINDVASELGADLIVTGSRGRGPLRSMLLGSVAAEVAAHASCPVLVARNTRVSRLLVATDGSPSAGLISDRLGGWGLFRGIPADVVAVAVHDGPTFELMVSMYTLGDERLTKQRRELEMRASNDADTMARRLADVGIPATPRVQSGDPANEIITAAESFGADLIVTGSRGLGTLDRLLLGSVARNVLIHARCSVLIVRTLAPADPRQKET